MPIDVVWQEMRWSDDSREPGYSVTLATLRDEHSLIQKLLEVAGTIDLPHLRFIDPRSVTLFHQQNIPQLIEELEFLGELPLEEAVDKHLHAVIDFVRRARGKGKTFITFQAVV